MRVHASAGQALRLVTRLTASATVGLGHFARCRALAEENLSRGGSNVLVAEPMPPWIETWARPVFARETVGAEEGPDLSPDRWRQIVARTHAAVVVFDHYGVSAQTHRTVAMLGVATAALDDVPERPLGTAVVLNQNVGVGEEEYRSLVAPATRLLIGPRYALVSHEIRRTVPRPLAAALRVLVSFGGGEHRTLVEQVLTAIQRLRVGQDVPRLDVTVVASDVDGRPWSAAGPHAIRVVPPLPGLGSLMADADVAIGAPGSTTYERLALGLPSILVQLSDNQAAVARGLIEAGAAVVIGRREDVTIEDWVVALQRVCDDPRVRDAMADVGRRLVDGRGTERVLDALAGAVAGRPAA